MSGGRHGALAVGSALVLLTALLWAPGGGVAAASEGCEWQPHKVRVVKHVKRHGKRVKVVRQKVRWACVPAAAAPSAPDASPGAPAPSPPPLPGPPVAPVAPGPVGEETGNPHWFGAQAFEFRFEPSGSSFEVSAGEDTIELINRGEDAHDLHLERISDGTPVAEVGATPSGRSARTRVDLTAGEYRLYCSFGEHAAKGMERTLVVVP